MSDYRPIDSAELARTLFRANLAGARVGLTSVCSAHPLVLRTACESARDAGQVALIEATCNQVNQEGGYTGMTPGDFVARARRAATAAGLPAARLLLGGDHLGPQPWRDLPAAQAMDRASAMVAAYVGAGFAKIHLDCSMPCADDAQPLPETAIADRAARLCAAAERASGPVRPVYIIGTEVPTPGGMGDGHEIVPTHPDSARATWATHRDAFAAAGLTEAFRRVVGIVVQPGLDFGNASVVHFDPAGGHGLTEAASTLAGPVFEAHSTDYQRPEAYRALVAGHFAILKVGPAATFALREALYALEAIEAELVAPADRCGLRAALETAMQGDPRHWQSHYTGDATTRRWLRHFSWSDRIRYYWTVPEVAAACARLRDTLDAVRWPLPLVGQYLPDLADALGRDTLAMRVDDVAVARIRRALAPYYAASATHEFKETV